MKPDPKYYAELAGTVRDALAFACPADINEHGEVQPRLPGDVGAIRDLAADFTHEPVPFELTAPEHIRTTFTASLFPGTEPGDWERKTGRRSARP